MQQIILSWSGGKDSALALDHLRHDPHVRVVALLTSVTEAYDRISIHGVRRSLLRAQAAATGLPLHEIVLQPTCTNEEYGAAVSRALTELAAHFPDARSVAFGDLFLEDVRRYREERMQPIGYECVFPLWGLDTAALARDFVNRGFEARLVCVDTTQLDRSFSGRAYDHALLDALPASVDPCGERGEFHTFVSSGPVFAAPVPYAVGETVLRDGRFAYCELMESADPLLT